MFPHGNECGPRLRHNGSMSPNVEELILYVDGATRVFGDYEWDRWEKNAREHGVPEELASLGRSLFREAQQHAWDADLFTECGWLDGGAAMIELALANPNAARRRWLYLMETDGERTDDSGNWIGRKEPL